MSTFARYLLIIVHSKRKRKREEGGSPVRCSEVNIRRKGRAKG